MNAQPIKKTCTTCGRDVAGLPRTKDTSGRYFCNPCWSVWVSQARPPAKPDAPAGLDPYDLAGVASTSIRPDLFNCDDCRGTFSNADVRFEDGEIVCRKCLAKRPPKPMAIPAATPATPPPTAIEPAPTKAKTQIFCLSISAVVVILCAAAVFPVFVDPESSESAKLTAAVVGVPIGAMFAWTAVEAMRGRASIHHKLTLPVAVIVGCLTFRTILDNADKSNRSGPNSPEAAEQARREERAATAFGRTREKADAMRQTGMTGTDEELARVYDRIKKVTGR